MKKINKYDEAHNITLKQKVKVWCGNDIDVNTPKPKLQPT